jgi:ketosteroid isomerase-like protein
MFLRVALVHAMVVLGCARAAAPQSASADVARAVAVVDAFHSAVKYGDAAAAARQLADDAVILEDGRAVAAKSGGDGVEPLAGYLQAAIEFERTVTIARTLVEVVLAGDAAWAVWKSTVTGTFEGRPVDRAGTELVVLGRTAEGWRIRGLSKG